MEIYRTHHDRSEDQEENSSLRIAPMVFFKELRLRVFIDDDEEICRYLESDMDRYCPRIIEHPDFHNVFYRVYKVPKDHWCLDGLNGIEVARLKLEGLI